MPIGFYRCSVCNREFSDIDEARECENKHAEIEKQIIVIAESIKKLYEIGGIVELTLGSNKGNALNCVGINTEKNTMCFKNWTIDNYKYPLFKVKD